MVAKLKQILADYGPIAFAIYMGLFFVVLIGIYLAIQAGWAPSGAAGNVSAWTAAYLLTKLTQPLRMAATVVLTPMVGQLRKRDIGPGA